MNVEEYRHTLDSCAGRVVPLGRRDRWDALQRWRERYAAKLHASRGRWKIGPYEWHVFSFGHAPALDRRHAIENYKAQDVGSFIVCPEREEFPAARVIGGTLPDYCLKSEDIYVWPIDLGWTMAFTHEESIGLGPYFSRCEWVQESFGATRS